MAERSIASPALHIDRVSRTFPGAVEALSEIDLTIEPDSFTAILGPSGCGKSTLLRIIAGLDRPTTGRVQNPFAPGASARTPANSSVAYVFQDSTLLPWRTVERNVQLPLEFSRQSSKQTRQRVDEALESVGLSDARDRFPAQLSGGMRMRVSLARALVTNPSLLLLDEPFAALDEITRQHLDDQLRALWQRHSMTVLFVTHSTTEAAYLADRAVVMSTRPGRIILDTPIGLPSQRSADIRSDTAFADQTRSLYEALARGGA